MTRVLGVDGCRAGWIGVLLDGVTSRVVFAPAIEELVAEAGAVAAVGIDIPIGLPDAGFREADLAARKALGPKWAAVFMTPVRVAIDAPTYSEANEITRRVTGAGLSRQAYALRAKILDVDAWIATGPSIPVYEVHPELSFVRMADNGCVPTPLASKKTWAGMHQRRELLRAEGITLEDDLGVAGKAAAVDDVLDAAAAAWSTARVTRGQAWSFPAERDGSGREVAIWA